MKPSYALRLSLLCCLLLLPAGRALGLDVRLLIDISDSMDRTDPENLRADAVGALIDLLPDGSRAGVWSFGEAVNRLVPHDRVSELWRVQAKARTGALAAVGLRTAIDRAIRAASWDAVGPVATRHLILLTDGDLDVSDDPARNRAAERELLEATVPKLNAQGFRIHTLGLSAAANHSLLRMLARETGGRYVDVAAASDLDTALTTLYGAIGDQDRLPVRQRSPEPAGSRGPIRSEFLVDAGVSAITVIAFKPPDQILELTDPAGDRYDRTRIPNAARWHSAEGHEVLTLTEPATGRWKIGGAERAEVFVLGDLRLSLVNAPVELAPAELSSLRAVLIDRRQGAPVPAAFARLLEWSAELKSTRKRPKVAVEPDGEGGALVYLTDLDAITEGLLTLKVSGRTFERSLEHGFRVVHPLRAELHAPTEGDEPIRLWVAIDQAGLDHRSLRLTAGVRRPPEAARWTPLVAEAGGLWSLAIDNVPGRLEITIDVEGTYYQGGKFNYRGGPLRLRLPLSGVQRLSFDERGAVRSLDAAEGPQPILRADGVEQPDSSAPVVLGPDSSPAATLGAASEAGEGAAAAISEPAVVLPLWFAGLALLVPLLIGGFVW
ncbi:MAG: vWA domain-containing protein, partial [Pseudomonadota bacterium]